MVRGAEALEIGGYHSHRGERDRQLGERGSLERTARHGEQLERLGDIGNGLGPDRVVGDQQRRELGDLGERVANRRCIGGGAASCDACGAQRPGGVLRDPRQSLGEFECC